MFWTSSKMSWNIKPHFRFCTSESAPHSNSAKSLMWKLILSWMPNVPLTDISVHTVSTPDLTNTVCWRTKQRVYSRMFIVFVYCINIWDKRWIHDGTDIHKAHQNVINGISFNHAQIQSATFSINSSNGQVVPRELMYWVVLILTVSRSVALPTEEIPVGRAACQGLCFVSVYDT